MADKGTKPSEAHKIEVDSSSADKENEPLLVSDNEKKREEREDGKSEGDDIKLNIGEQYMVRRADETWRKLYLFFFPLIQISTGCEA